MKICKMRDSDWASVSKIYEDGIKAKKYTIVKELPSFDKWSNDHIKKLCFVSKITNQIIGFITLSQHRNKPNVGIISVYVKNGFKRQGIATKLLEKLKKESMKYGYEAYILIYFLIISQAFYCIKKAVLF